MSTAASPDGQWQSPHRRVDLEWWHFHPPESRQTLLVETVQNFEQGARGLREMVRYLQPTQQQLDQFQEDLVLCAAGPLEDDELCWAFTQQTDTIIMTVSWVAAQRVNRIVSHKLFADKEPLSRVPCAAVAGQDFILPYKGMHIVINENRNKAACIVDGQDAKLISSNGNTILLEFPDGERAFVH